MIKPTIDLAPLYLQGDNNTKKEKCHANYTLDFNDHNNTYIVRL